MLRLFDELVLVLESGQALDATKIARTIDMVADDLRPSEVLRHEVVRGAKGKAVRPSTAGQKRYTDAIDNSIITFGIGPAGTGKSYLAVAQAVQALHRRQVQRIVLTRPAVEAGENLGFLPGDLMAKVDPYLRPLYDALYDMVGPDGRPAPHRQRHDRGRAARLHARAHAERLVHHPRRGAEHDARADEDVPDAHRLQLQGRRDRRRHPDRPQRQAQRARRRSRGSSANIEGISFVHLGAKDVVRHRIVADIVAAYERSS